MIMATHMINKEELWGNGRKEKEVEENI